MTAAGMEALEIWLAPGPHEVVTGTDFFGLDIYVANRSREPVSTGACGLGSYATAVVGPADPEPTDWLATATSCPELLVIPAGFQGVISGVELSAISPGDVLAPGPYVGIVDLDHLDIRLTTTLTLIDPTATPSQPALKPQLAPPPNLATFEMPVPGLTYTQAGMSPVVIEFNGACSYATHNDTRRAALVWPHGHVAISEDQTVTFVDPLRGTTTVIPPGAQVTIGQYPYNPDRSVQPLDPNCQAPETIEVTSIALLPTE